MCMMDSILVDSKTKSSEKRLSPVPMMCYALLLLVITMPTIFELSRRALSTKHLERNRNLSTATTLTTQHSSQNEEQHLKFVTLCFNQSMVKPMVDHNCAMLSQTGYPFFIYTDDLSQPYCSVCVCRPFVLTGCLCPQPERFDCSLCEKLHFIVDLVQSMSSFVFIDSDLIILKQDFMPALQARTTHFDFLAAYGFGPYRNWRYSSQFNSGLMFIRRLSSINYTDMIQLMHTMGTNNDQNVISAFIQSHYARWDTLSLRWHCRYLFRSEHNINFSTCLTFHGRQKALNSSVSVGGLSFKLLSSSSSPSSSMDKQR